MKCLGNQAFHSLRYFLFIISTAQRDWIVCLWLWFTVENPVEYGSKNMQKSVDPNQNINAYPWLLKIDID